MNKQILLVDIGNTTFDFDLLNGDNHFYEKIKITEKEKLITYIKSIKNNLSDVFISSVNKSGKETLTTILSTEKIKYTLITPSIMKEYALANKYNISNTDYLGCDLFCDVIAPNCDNCIIIDLGTVGKILLLDKNKDFKGASIFPDIEQFPKMMDASTDLLKNLSLNENPPTVSLKTDECISSGSILGMCALISGLIHRIENEYSLKNEPIYLTGGCSNYIEKFLPQFQINNLILDKHLCLKGIQRIKEFIERGKTK